MSRDKIEMNEATAIQRVSKRERELNPAVPGVAKPAEPQPLPEEPEEKVPPQALIPPVVHIPREIPPERSRKVDEQGEYETLFIRNAPSTTRSGKAVYIRKEFHERIMRIVQVIGYNELSLFSYIDNVLEQHFNQYQDDISELYKKRNPKIF
jgi:hypothetical protein